MPAYYDAGFCVRQPSWHGEEDLLIDWPEDWPTARRLAHLEWEPVEVPVYEQRGGSEDAPVFVPLAGFKGIARSDTGAMLAVPTKKFSIITHEMVGEIIEAILGDQRTRFETAGAAAEGRKVWALIRLDEPFEIHGDRTMTFPYLAVLLSHDGTGACKVLYTIVRVVCWNTWHAASEEGDRTGAQYVFRHVGNPRERIAEAAESLAGLRKTAEAYRQEMDALARIRTDDAMVRTFLSEFIPHPTEQVGEVVSARVHENIERARGLFMATLNESPTTEGIRGSAYGLLMASTEYLDHLRAFRTRDSYLGRTVLRPEAHKQRSLGLIRDLVGVGS